MDDRETLEAPNGSFEQGFGFNDTELKIPNLLMCLSISLSSFSCTRKPKGRRWKKPECALLAKMSAVCEVKLTVSPTCRRNPALTSLDGVSSRYHVNKGRKIGQGHVHEPNVPAVGVRPPVGIHVLDNRVRPSSYVVCSISARSLQDGNGHTWTS